MTDLFVKPRPVPERDSKYMGLAWFYASFSKDPNTQIGSCVVSSSNKLIGCGYNGPPRKIQDDSFSWERPSKNNPNSLSKYDLITHAEINAMGDLSASLLQDSTLYVTAMPCEDCMLKMIEKEIGRVVYFDFKSESGSMLQNSEYYEKTMKLADMGSVQVDLFDQNINWVSDWVSKLKVLGVFK